MMQKPTKKEKTPNALQICNFTFDLFSKEYTDSDEKIQEIYDNLKKICHAIQIEPKTIDLIKKYGQSEYKINNQEIQMRELEKSWLNGSDFYKIKKFYTKITSTSDQEFQAICNKLDCKNTKSLMLWKSIVNSYTKKSTYDFVVPKTSIDLVKKLASLCSCDESQGTGMYLFSSYNKPIGAIGVTKMTERESDVEINYIILNENFKQLGIAQNLMARFLIEWNKTFN